MISAKRPPLWLTEVMWEFLDIRSAVRRGSPRASATCVDDVYLIAYAPIGSYVPYHRCIYVERTEFVARPAQYCRSRDRTGPVTRRRAATAIFGNGTIVRSGMFNRFAAPTRFRYNPQTSVGNPSSTTPHTTSPSCTNFGLC